VIAADLSNGKGESCSGLAVWHFVNNQTEGASGGTLTATFTVNGVTSFYTVDAYKIGKSNLQFSVTTEGDAVLVNATTGDVPGRLVLSDKDCDTSKEPKK